MWVASFLESLQRFERIKVWKIVEREFLQLETHIKARQNNGNQPNKNPVSIWSFIDWEVAKKKKKKKPYKEVFLIWE